MIIRVKYLEEISEIESSVPVSVSEVLERIDVSPSTVLAIHDETIIPHTSMINGDIKLELIVVSSGG